MPVILPLAGLVPLKPRAGFGDISVDPKSCTPPIKSGQCGPRAIDPSYDDIKRRWEFMISPDIVLSQRQQ
jgi:hypothetical protein